MQKSHSLEAVIESAKVSYQSRHHSQHRTLTKHLSQYFPDHSPKQLKMLTFYIVLCNGEAFITQEDHSVDSIVLNNYDTRNPEAERILQRVQKNQKIHIEEGCIALIIDSKHLHTVDILTDTTIEEEITFLQSSPHFQGVSRKKLYGLVRNCSVIKSVINQVIFREGEQIMQQGEAGLYLIREGECSVLKKVNGKNKQIYSLGVGNLFGAEDLVRTSENIVQERSYTVKGKSSSIILYQFNAELFSTIVEKSCEEIAEDFRKIPALLLQRFHSLSKPKYLSQKSKPDTPKRHQSLVKFKSIPQSMKNHIPLSVKKVLTTLLPEMKMSVHEKLVDKNKLKLILPHTTDQVKYASDIYQYKQLQKLTQKKQKCKSIRRLFQPETGRSRGQILFQLFKDSWQFERQKRFQRHH